MRLTSEQLAEIRARVDAAPSGPWCYDTYGASALLMRGPAADPDVLAENDLSDLSEHEAEGRAYVRATFAFLAASRQDVPALLDEVEALRAERDEALEAARVLGVRA